MTGATRPPIMTHTWNSDSLGSVGTQLAHRPQALGQQHQKFQNTEKSPTKPHTPSFFGLLQKPFFKKKNPNEIHFISSYMAAPTRELILICSTSGYATAGKGVIFVHSGVADWEVLQMHALWVLTDWHGTYRRDSRLLKFKSCEEST